MKILHTADWHLGKKLYQHPRHAEQVEVLSEICDIAQREAVDVVLIAGDLFDNPTPSNESSELFYKTLKRLTRGGECAVVAIAGNHDSPERIEAPDPLARECGIIFAGFPYSTVPIFALPSGIQVLRSTAGFIELQLPRVAYPLRLLLTPYANEFRLKKYLGIENPETILREILETQWANLATQYLDNQGVNLLVAHLYFMQKDGIAPEEPDGERAIHVGGAQAVFAQSIPPQVQYAALGHLHRYQVIAEQPCPVVYSSSPLAYSFSEANQSKYVVLLDAQPHRAVHFEKIELQTTKKLIQHRAPSVAAALEWLNENQTVLVELTVESDTYLTADENRSLQQAHPNIVNLIPVIRTQAGEKQAVTTRHLVGNSMEDLFSAYFQHRKNGQLPNDELLALFKEVLAQED